MSTQKFSGIAQISTANPVLTLRLAGANVKIRHENRRGIEVLSNNPHIWTIEGASISQKVAPKPTAKAAKDNDVADGGVSIKGKVTNSNISSPGFVSIEGDLIDSNIFTSNGATYNSGGNFFGGNGNCLNGQQVGDNLAAEPEAESDWLEIVVPDSFLGSLDLKNSGDGNVVIDRWKGGDFIVENERGGSLTIGQLCEIIRCDLLSRGIGSIEFDSVVSQSFDAKLYGAGDLSVEHLQTDSLSVQLYGTGSVHIFNGEAKSGSVANYGTGNVTLRGAFSSIRPSNYGVGSVRIRPRESYMSTKF